MNQTTPVADPTTMVPAPINPAIVAHRIVQAGMFLSLVWKWSFFSGAVSVYAAIPIDDAFFPKFFQSIWVACLVYLGTATAIALSLVTASRKLQMACSGITFAGATILCWHQATYNDMTFVTLWWTSLWTIWYVWHLDDCDRPLLLRRAAFLSRLIISMILLGGAAGKWTSEYWSGEVFYDIYFRDRDFWLFNLLRKSFEPDTLREIATWYSRQVIVVETVAGLGLWLLPARWAATIAIIVLTSIALLSNFLLFSVLMCLIGLAAVGFFVRRNQVAEQ